jgi:hypothetical protein
MQLTVLRIQNNARCGYRSLQTFERPRNETSNVETQFVDKELINLTTLIFLLINQGNQHF